MDLQRAKEITAKCLETSVSLLMNDRYQPLPDYTLEEMLEANRLVAEMGPEDAGDGTSRSYMHVDPRGIALHYAFKHFGLHPVQMLDALGFSFDEEWIEICADCWKFTRKYDVLFKNGHLYCVDCRTLLEEQEEERRHAETQTTTD